jgi:hypothetical protein
MKRSLEQTRSVAYHEAGHAIAALVLHQRFAGVTIKTSKSSWGKLDGFRSNACPMSSAIVYLSGPLAQSIMRHQKMLCCCGDYYLNCGGDVDFRQACVHIDFVYYQISNIKYNGLPKTYTPCKRKLHQEILLTSERLVNDNHDQIETLAEKLLKKETLWHTDIVQLLVKRKLFDSLVSPQMPKLEHF